MVFLFNDKKSLQTINILPKLYFWLFIQHNKNKLFILQNFYPYANKSHLFYIYTVRLRVPVHKLLETHFHMTTL